MVPIHYAVLKNNLPMVAWLIEHKAEEIVVSKYKLLVGNQVTEIKKRLTQSDAEKLQLEA